MLLSSEQRSLLRALVGKRVRQLVWDLNAIYFVGAPEADQTIRVECLADRPATPDADEFDEAVYLTVEIDPEAGPFLREGEPEYWYRVVSENDIIERIEIVRSYVGTPGSFALHPGQQPAVAASVTAADSGLLVTTSRGVLPAVQLQPSFGFATWSDIRLHSRSEVDATLQAQYEILPL